MTEMPEGVESVDVTDTQARFLENVSIFGSLTEDELAVVMEHIEYYRIDAQKTLFREGDFGSYVCFVIEGKVDIVKESPSGKRVVVATLSQGSSLGEMSLIDDTPRSATILVREPSLLCLFSKQSFDQILETHPKIGIKVLKGIARFLSGNLRNTTTRLANYLLPLH